MLIGANWKMNPRTFSEAKELCRGVSGSEGVDVVLFPPAVYLRQLAEAFPHILFGVQNVYWESEGAFTGEMSLGMAREAGAHYVLAGHSERRQHFGETDEMVSKKVAAALAKGFSVILAVGEATKGDDKSIVIESLKRSTQNVAETDMTRLTVAYEPIWAISTSENHEDATPEYAQEMIHTLKQEVAVGYIYGGSVSIDNVAGFLQQPDIEGALVGGASLKKDEFNEIISVARSLKK